MAVPVEAITRDRLAKWTKRLDQEHATPFALVGIGHDHKSGQLVLCVCEDTPLPEIRDLLQRVVFELSMPDAEIER